MGLSRRKPERQLATSETPGAATSCGSAGRWEPRRGSRAVGLLFPPAKQAAAGKVLLGLQQRSVHPNGVGKSLGGRRQVEKRLSEEVSTACELDGQAEDAFRVIGSHQVSLSSLFHTNLIKPCSHRLCHGEWKRRCHPSPSICPQRGDVTGTLSGPSSSALPAIPRHDTATSAKPQQARPEPVRLLRAPKKTGS